MTGKNDTGKKETADFNGKLFIFRAGIENKKNIKTLQIVHGDFFRGQEMSVVLQGFSPRKTRHYLRARQARRPTTSGIKTRKRRDIRYIQCRAFRVSGDTDFGPIQFQRPCAHVTRVQCPHVLHLLAGTRLYRSGDTRFFKDN